MSACAIPLLAGCQSDIQPMRPLQRVELWVPSDGSAPIELTPPMPVPPARPALALISPTTSGGQSAAPLREVIPPNAATMPAATQGAATPSAAAPASATQSAAKANTTAPAAAMASTQSAAAQTASTQTASTQSAATLPAHLPPGKEVTQIIDPNETARFVYKATYANIWQQALLLTSRLGFALDREDYRLGVITTLPLPSSQMIEFWKPQQTDLKNAIENTINSQQRSIRITISNVPGKPDFYQIAVQVLVERETNPSEVVGGPLYVEGSGFGRSSIALRSDYATPATELPRWVILGHDVQLERKLLHQLFLRI